MPAKQRSKPSDKYDPSVFPAFAVTVDIVIFSLEDGELKVLLIRRGAPPFKGSWALPGGFKQPTETLDQAARRELIDETGVAAPGYLRQFGAYGDPGRDPRMNVVTVGYVAILTEPAVAQAGTDAAHAEFRRIDAALADPLAFDHHRILTDALAHLRNELELTGLAARFVAPTFTIAELRSVYEAIWDTKLDQANLRRTLLTDDGWLEPTGRTATPGPAGGKPAEVFRPGPNWVHSSPLRRKPADRSEEST